MLRGNQAIGVIATQSYETAKHYNEHDLDLLSAVANQATVAIDNARRFQETQAKARREQLLREITARVHSSADADTILRTAVREVSSALGRQAIIQLGTQEKKENQDAQNIVTDSSPTTPLDQEKNGQNESQNEE